MAWQHPRVFSCIYLKLIDCNSCMHLPPIGQLPKLRYLEIDGVTGLTKTGPEFVGCGGANPMSKDAILAFPKLEMLRIQDMPNWEEWSIVKEEDDATSTTAVEGKEEALSPRIQMLPRLK